MAMPLSAKNLYSTLKNFGLIPNPAKILSLYFNMDVDNVTFNLFSEIGSEIWQIQRR